MAFSANVHNARDAWVQAMDALTQDLETLKAQRGALPPDEFERRLADIDARRDLHFRSAPFDWAAAAAPGGDELLLPRVAARDFAAELQQAGSDADALEAGLAHLHARQRELEQLRAAAADGNALPQDEEMLLSASDPMLSASLMETTDGPAEMAQALLNAELAALQRVRADGERALLAALAAGAAGAAAGVPTLESTLRAAVRPQWRHLFLRVRTEFDPRALDPTLGRHHLLRAQQHAIAGARAVRPRRRPAGAPPPSSRRKSTQQLAQRLPPQERVFADGQYLPSAGDWSAAELEPNGSVDPPDLPYFSTDYGTHTSSSDDDEDDADGHGARGAAYRRARRDEHALVAHSIDRIRATDARLAAAFNGGDDEEEEEAARAMVGEGARALLRWSGTTSGAAELWLIDRNERYEVLFLEGRGVPESLRHAAADGAVLDAGFGLRYDAGPRLSMLWLRIHHNLPAGWEDLAVWPRASPLYGFDSALDARAWLMRRAVASALCVGIMRGGRVPRRGGGFQAARLGHAPATLAMKQEGAVMAHACAFLATHMRDAERLPPAALWRLLTRGLFVSV